MSEYYELFKNLTGKYNAPRYFQWCMLKGGLGLASKRGGYKRVEKFVSENDAFDRLLSFMLLKNYPINLTMRETKIILEKNDKRIIANIDNFVFNFYRAIKNRDVSSVKRIRRKLDKYLNEVI